jgi:hypothetical protein
MCCFVCVENDQSFEIEEDGKYERLIVGNRLWD